MRESMAIRSQHKDYMIPIGLPVRGYDVDGTTFELKLKFNALSVKYERRQEQRQQQQQQLSQC